MNSPFNFFFFFSICRTLLSYLARLSKTELTDAVDPIVAPNEKLGAGAGQETPEIFVYASSNKK